METIINKVAESGLITLDLATYLPNENDLAIFDLKPFLFKEMILREKDYRLALQTVDWSQYANKHIAILCTADAIIPVWAFMLAVTYLQPNCASIYYGTKDEMKKQLIHTLISKIDVTDYIDKRVVIKGCGDIAIPDAAFIYITEHLQNVVKSIMYGEPCSTVPIYKKAQRAM